jgi:cell division protein FtsI/penicillin-binding protein 2
MQERGIQMRIWLVAAVLFLGLCGLSARLSYLHLGNHSKVKREYTRELLGLRGRIFDCNADQFPMAVSLPARQFFLDPKAVKKGHDVRAISKTVAEALGLEESDVLEKFRQPNARYIKLGISTSDQAFSLLSDAKRISGVGAEELPIRSYPQGRRMAHVLGFVNNLGVGGAGIEQAYNRYLKGTPGLITSEMDAGRIEIWSRRKVHVPPIPGDDVYLTLDHNIQYEVERELKDVVEQFQAVRGWVHFAAAPDLDAPRIHLARDQAGRPFQVAVVRLLDARAAHAQVVHKAQHVRHAAALRIGADRQLFGSHAADPLGVRQQRERLVAGRNAQLDVAGVRLPELL